jgi:osmotically-inducible protein OsmY
MSSPLSDTMVALDANAALRDGIGIPETVLANVVDHRVVLSGWVAWGHERDAAGRAVGHLPGVRAVRNNLVLRPTSPAPELKTALRAALLRCAEQEGRGITITRDANGGVRLQGEVHCPRESRVAEAVCWNAPGVTAVANHLHVQSPAREALLPGRPERLLAPRG